MEADGSGTERYLPTEYGLIPTVHNSEIHCYIVKSNNLSTTFGVLLKKYKN
jgi:hypothetical protein